MGDSGHPLFEAVREHASIHTEADLRRGAVFFDLYRENPTRLDLFSAAVADGRGNALHRRLFAVETNMDGSMSIRQPTIFLDLIPSGSAVGVPDGDDLPDREAVEGYLFEKALQPFLVEVVSQRERELQTIERHMEISLNELINRQNLRLAELVTRQQAGDSSPLIAANIKMTEDRVDELNLRLERRRRELGQERQLTVSDIHHHGRAWVLPHPDRGSPEIGVAVQDKEIEEIAVRAVTAYEEARGWQVESVEAENRGFDLISRRPHPEDPKTAIEVRFIEVKGRSGVGEIALTTNEYKTAERLKKDYWLYVVYNSSTKPEVHTIQDPARLGWEPLVKIEHYHVGSDKILGAEK